MSDESRRHSWTMKRKYSCCFAALRNLAALEAFGHQAHRRDRRAQFVRDAGDEIGFHFVEHLLALERPPRREQAGQRGHGRDQHQRAEPESARDLMSVQGRRARQINTDLQRFHAAVHPGGRRQNFGRRSVKDFKSGAFFTTLATPGPDAKVRSESVKFSTGHLQSHAQIFRNRFGALDDLSKAPAEFRFAVTDEPMAGLVLVESDREPFPVRNFTRKNPVPRAFDHGVRRSFSKAAVQRHRRVEPQQARGDGVRGVALCFRQRRAKLQLLIFRIRAVSSSNAKSRGTGNPLRARNSGRAVENNWREVSCCSQMPCHLRIAASSSSHCFLEVCRGEVSGTVAESDVH